MRVVLVPVLSADSFLDPEACIEFLLPHIAVWHIITPWSPCFGRSNIAVGRLRDLSDVIVEHFVNFGCLADVFGSDPYHYQISRQSLTWSERLGAHLAE